MGDPFICSACITDKKFSTWINNNGQCGRCEIDTSHGVRKGVRASELAVEVDGWFRENYVLGAFDYRASENSDKPSYEQLGSFYAEIMSEGLGCDEDVVKTFEEYLPDVSHRDITQGAEPFYDGTASYELIKNVQARNNAEELEYWYETRFSLQWQDFCESVVYHKRFFGAKEQLDALFGDPTEFEKGNICPLYLLPEGQVIHRARLLDDETVIDKVRSNSSSELGAPPKDRTRAGRMNVEFIPAFYGAFSDETAVAETRPGIGEIIAIGKFQTRMPVRVFDFTAFAMKEGQDRSEIYDHTRYDFISQMEGEISKPVHPSDRQREYIPTQMTAEYLGEIFGCDAVIYRSSMIKGQKKETRNIVFLNKGVPYLNHPASLLEFKSYEMLEVCDVMYKLEPHLPF